MGAGTGAEPDVRYARGVAAYARIFGVPEDRLAAAFASRVGPVFAEEQLQAAGGAAWADPALSGRDRSVAIITTLVAQGVTGDRLVAHLDLARRNGLDDDALTALMVLLASYLGYAHASLAMEIIHARAAAPRKPAR
jgi:alkylhydroperoxidase/carboxymuconolactone decarboxylase family protein YurZ